MKIIFISFLAGISTILGCFPTYLPYSYHEKIIGLSLSFSAGIMISISIFSLIPEAFSYLNTVPFIVSFLLFSLFFVLGVISSQTIDNIISNMGNDSKLYQLGIISMITLMIHNIPEGVMTYLTISSDFHLGLSLSMAIAIHNIPEGIAIAIPIYYSCKKRKMAFFYTALSGFSELFGAILSFLFLRRYISSYLLMTILSMTAGIMMDISFLELIPNSFQYISIKDFIYSFLLGIIVMIVCIYFFQI